MIALIVIGLLIVSVGSASAQGGRRGGMMGRMGGGLGLLRMESVQKELKMTQPQIEKLDSKQQEVRAQMQELFQNSGGFQNMSPEDRQKLFAKSQEIQHKAVADILDTTQMKRFEQLELQQQGPSALMRKDIADRLKLTEAQRSKLMGIQQQAQSDMRALFQGGGFGNMTEENRQKFQAIQKTANEKALAVLTAEQQKQWKQMLGAPFTFGPPPGRQQQPGA
jgi:Spy/CpxP family protein refolding chaperone